ncbi:sporulation integral membrane protein YtvI [Salipaludibacillus neizhouensis]|uniref:Sporulation integral membrane protein YtvI n=1 Tax=Salipaludibacillus neizhouensis TaxID=885475 RepID=A0A3A9K4C3_9BACI|nr:sporulation integral membrane protein YtvI [Salipaludibacillus neizhouensis]RKL66178.1 sporulation integral membrane protein YtvI [Salipaludibacillus neizhouensis]
MTKTHGWIFARLLLVIIIILSVLWFTGWLFTISYPFWIAALLVWMFHPLIRLLRAKVNFPNGLAVLVALLLGLSTLFGAITGLVFLIIFGVRRISDFIPNWIQTTATQVQEVFNESIFPIWQQLTGVIDELTPEQQATLQDGIATLGTRLASTLADYGQQLADGLTQLIIIVPSFLLAFFFIFIAFYFIGKDWEKLFRKVYDITPAPLIKKSKAFRNMLQYRVFGFLRAQVILMIIASILVFIGLAILRVEHALTIAMIVGIAEILPYLGSGTILIPWFLYMFFTGDISMGIGLAIVYGVTIGIRQAIEPKILSSSMNLNALAVLVSLFVGFQIFGILGVFLGPLILVILVIFKDIGLADDVSNFVKHGFKEDPTPKKVYHKNN